MSETAVSRAIRDALALESGLVLERLQAGSARGGRQHLARRGAADLVGTLRIECKFFAEHAVRIAIVGRAIALEIKDPMAKPQPKHDAEQCEWAQRWRDAGGFYARVSSVEAARAAIKRARSGASQ